MTKPKMFDFVVTEKGRYALACALAGYLATTMDHDDLIGYYFDHKLEEFLAKEDKLVEGLAEHGEDMLEFIGKMNKKLT